MKLRWRPAPFEARYEAMRDGMPLPVGDPAVFSAFIGIHILLSEPVMAGAWRR